MALTLPLFFVASSLFVSLEYIDALPPDQIPTCGNTELCRLLPNESIRIPCNCSPSTRCSWSRFVDRREILSYDTTESVLMWPTIGRYGQYICVRDNSTVAARNIMILPEDQDQSCDDCISTRVCIIAARTYLTFTLLFNQSLIHSECELLLNGHPSQTITEQSCVDVQDVSSNNYSIQCPICQQGDQNINHVIRNSNFTNCSDSDICNTIFRTSSTAVATTVSSIATSVVTVTTSPSFPTASSSTSTVVTSAVTLTSVLRTTTMLTASSISDFCSSRSPTTTATSTMTTNVSTATTTTYIIMTATSTTFAVTTTVNMSGKSNDSGSDNGAVIGGVVGGVIGVIFLVIVVVVVVLVRCIIKRQHRRNLMHLPPSSSEQQQPVIPISNLTSSGLVAGEVDSWQGTVAPTGDNNGSSTQEMISQLLALSDLQLMDVIIENHPIINKKIKFDILIQYLNKYHIFTPNEMCTFNNQCISSEEKVNRLITWLEKKKEDGVQNFVRALNDAHEHSGHVAILEQLHKCSVTTI